MANEDVLIIDCNELSRGLDNLFRKKYNEYLFALDMDLLSDFIIEYILCRENVNSALFWLGWDKLIEDEDILANLKQFLIDNLPPIKRRIFEYTMEITQDTDISVEVNNTSILLIFKFDKGDMRLTT